MSEFFFVVKTVLFSALLLMLLQMKVRGTTIEQHAEGWIYHSQVGNEMQAVARGAVKAGQEGFDWFREQSRDVSEPSARETKRERPSRSHSHRDDLD